MKYLTIEIDDLTALKLTYLIKASIQIRIDFFDKSRAETRIVDFDDEHIYTSPDGIWERASMRQRMEETSCCFRYSQVEKVTVAWAHLIMGEVAGSLSPAGKMLIDREMGTTYQDL